MLRETAYTTGIAWGLSVITGLIGMVALGAAVFTPLGLTLDPLNLTPWIYTLPIPVLVLVVTTVTTGRVLSKLDPVSIIDRRVS
jgi:hypothetical protein